MTEAEAKATLAAFDGLGGPERWIAEQPREPAMGGWTVPGDLQGWRFQVEPAPGGAAGGGFTCGAKRHCTEMASCAEARFYLSQCGAPQLDSDGDGTPCDALCRR